MNNLRERKTYRVSVIILLIILCFLALIVATTFGTYKLSFIEVVKAIFYEREGMNRAIIWSIRFSRNIVAGLVGMCLALSGAILQGVMKNPLASPNIIGVSAGAGLAAISIMILFPHLTYLVTPMSFIGALLATMTIYILSWKDGISPLRVILSGIAISSFIGAGINTLLIFFPDRVYGVVDFMVGGLSAVGFKQANLIWPYAIIGLISSIIIAKKLNILQLGDDVAKSLGVNLELTRFILIALASLLAASAVSIVGLLGFVGLIVPHIARMIIGSDYRYLLPASALLGALILILCDTIARTILSPIELPVGIIMAAIGGPFFLYLLRNGIKGRTN